MPLVSAMRSWLARDRRLTRRPIPSAGSTTRVITPTTASMRRGLVATNMPIAPSTMTRLRSPIERLDPTAPWITVASAVRRERTSPVFKVSKNCGLWRSTCA